MDSVFSLSVNSLYFFKGRNNLKGLILLLLSNLWSSLELPERVSMPTKMAYIYMDVWKGVPLWQGKLQYLVKVTSQALLSPG